MLELKKILLEAVLVTVVGAALAFTANVISSRGLALANDYFPGKPVTPESSAPATPSSAGMNTNLPASASDESVLLRIKQNGLQLVDVNQAVQLFHDPRSQQELILFVDARNDQEYHEGHIPAAYLFDNYHPEKYLADVMSAAQTAEKVVVYCHGGDCDDSVSAAITLRDAGIPNQKLFVYAGGITEWMADKLPVEIGERKSGQLQKVNK